MTGRWPITTPGGSDERSGEYAHADGSRWIQVWDEDFFGGPTINSPEELEEFVSELRAAAGRCWPPAGHQ